MVALVVAVGQVSLRLLANVLSMFVSWVGYSRSVKEVQWPFPIVWPPERATTSVGVKDFVDKESRMTVALLDGAGRF